MKERSLQILRRVKNVALIAIIAALAVVMAVTVISRVMGMPPTIFGLSMFRVSSGSMEPALAVGDIIVVQACDGSTVKENDIVSYLSDSGETTGQIVTHRVFKAPYQKGDSIYLVTKGDANPTEDRPILATQIKGRLLCKLPFLKWLFDVFSTPWGLLALIALVLLAFSGELIRLIKIFRGSEQIE